MMRFCFSQDEETRERRNCHPKWHIDVIRNGCEVLEELIDWIQVQKLAKALNVMSETASIPRHPKQNDCKPENETSNTIRDQGTQTIPNQEGGHSSNISFDFVSVLERCKSLSYELNRHKKSIESYEVIIARLDLELTYEREEVLRLCQENLRLEKEKASLIPCTNTSATSFQDSEPANQTIFFADSQSLNRKDHCDHSETTHLGLHTTSTATDRRHDDSDWELQSSVGSLEYVSQIEI